MKKNKMCIVIIFFIMLLFFVYAYMFFSTNSVIEDFTNCVRGKNISDMLKNTEMYAWYSESDGLVDKSDVDIKRYFVIHNFSKGVMYVNYTFEMFDEKGSRIRGASNITSKWYIQKQKDRWIVTKIVEKP